MDQQLINEIDILPMTPEDYDDVRALWMTIRGFGIRALDDSREDIERFIQRCRKSRQPDHRHNSVWF